ncbi:MAG: peptidoglycan editing factor PgeF [bacterium]|nr:peptidoglycan editing factor PgeF [bacterium]
MIKSNTLNLDDCQGLQYITFPHFDKTGLIRHAFSTRFGGVSQGIYQTMNFSFTNGDARENVLENYRRICNAIGVDYHNCVLSFQTHTNNVRIVTDDDIGKGIFKDRDYNDIDALITNIPGIVLVLQFADCVPLLFLDPEKKVIANAHAGWKGTVSKIAEKTVASMQKKFGCNPSDILVGIAPSIMQCCFEVDQPVFEQFERIDGVNINDICIFKGNGKYNINLQKTNCIILENTGIRPENIVVTDLCTKCNSDTFHSHRATNGKRGNNASFISLV